MTSLYDEVRGNTDIAKILGKMTPYGEPAEDIPIQSADLICYLVRRFGRKSTSYQPTGERARLWPIYWLAIRPLARFVFSNRTFSAPKLSKGSFVLTKALTTNLATEMESLSAMNWK
jgi:hypothetical protein